MRDLDKLPLRELQKLSARVMAVISADNNTIWKFNQVAHHNSQNWYKTVIKWYIDEYGGWPDEAGPAKSVKLIMED